MYKILKIYKTHNIKNTIIQFYFYNIKFFIYIFIYQSSQSTCDIEDEVKKAIKHFRFRTSQKNAALLIKVNRQKQTVCLDKLIEVFK